MVDWKFSSYGALVLENECFVFEEMTARASSYKGM